VVRFAARGLAAAVVAMLILYAALLGAASLPWHPFQGLPHSCPQGSPAFLCSYGLRPAWVVPTASGIAFVGLAGAAGVLAAARRRRTAAFLSEEQTDATKKVVLLSTRAR